MLTKFSEKLMTPRCVDAIGLYSSWREISCVFRLSELNLQKPGEFGGHLRRSFLGALGQTASEAAKANEPCTMDPPCALDIFCREQFRTAGHGLPKPFIIRHWRDAQGVSVELRLFGKACGWSTEAFNGFASGLNDILPWQHVQRRSLAAPMITSREIRIFQFETPRAPEQVELEFETLVDATGKDIATNPESLFKRLLRRVDSLSLWNGVALDPELGRQLANHMSGLSFDTSKLRRTFFDSPNQKRQNRRDPALAGRIRVSGDLEPVWPILRIAERCHVGRHAVEGIGGFKLIEHPLRSLGRERTNPSNTPHKTENVLGVSGITGGP